MIDGFELHLLSDQGIVIEVEPFDYYYDHNGNKIFYESTDRGV